MPPLKTRPNAKIRPSRAFSNLPEQSQKKSAGEKSGRARLVRAELRRSVIQAARARLKPAYKNQPYADPSITALHEEYLSLLGKPGSAAGPPTLPTDDEVISIASSINSFDDLADLYYSLRYKGDGSAKPLSKLTFDELSVSVSVLLTLVELSRADRQALIKTSRETLIKDMKLLGIKGRSRAKRSG